jgi:hypothetical protein
MRLNWNRLAGFGVVSGERQFAATPPPWRVPVFADGHHAKSNQRSTPTCSGIMPTGQKVRLPLALGGYIWFAANASSPLWTLAKVQSGVTGTSFRLRAPFQI